MTSTVETILVQFIQTNVSASIYPLVSPQDSPYPFIVYKRRGGNTVMTMDGPSYRNESYTFTIYTRTMAATQDLRNQLIGLMSGLIDQGLSILNTNEMEEYDEALDVYTCELDFAVINNTTLPSVQIVTGILKSTYTVPTASYAMFTETASFSVATNAITSSYVPFTGIAGLPSLFSSSAQVNFTQIQNQPTTASYATNAATYSASFSTRLTANFVSSSAQLSNGGGAAFGPTNSVTFAQVTASAMNVGTLVVTTISSSVDFSSGSNSFGNSQANVQRFTGSVSITGSLFSSGPITGSGIQLAGLLSSSTADINGPVSIGQFQTDNHQVTGSINVSGNITGSSMILSGLLSGSSADINGVTMIGQVSSNQHQVTGSLSISGSSLAIIGGSITASVVSGSQFTGSLFGTSSFALTASYALYPPQTNIQIFTSSGTWTKPNGAQSITVFAVDGGGGGGAGSAFSHSIASSGGAGGGGGSVTVIDIPASLLTNTVSVTVGQGGLGGTGSMSGQGQGTLTTGYGTRSGFGSILSPFAQNGYFAGPGGAGSNGSNSTAGTGGPYGTYPGGAGGQGISGNIGSGAGLGLFNGLGLGGGGGAGGGGVSAAGLDKTGGSGAAVSTVFNNIYVVGGQAGATTGSNGNSGSFYSTYPTFSWGAGGGAGGYSSVTVGGGNGGNGGVPGGGGGGGGSCLSGSLSGAGGNGGNGLVIVTTYF